MACGGGKSIGQLMGALQYVDIPGYSAILFRKTYADLSLPGALISIAKQWLYKYVETGEVHWSDKEKKFTFPSGATVAFGYLDAADDHLRYQGAEFQYIGVDECTHILPASYTYMFSRLRKSDALPDFVPLRFRATCNPGGMYGEYYYQRFFVEGPAAKRVFISAGIDDNPHINKAEYVEALNELDPVTRAQLLDGNWNVKESGNMFDRLWFPTISLLEIPQYVTRVRYWDMASSDPTKTSNRKLKDPDYTASVKLSYAQGIYYIENIVRFRKKPRETEEIIQRTADSDGYTVAIRMEQEPGSSGEITTDHYARNILNGYNFMGIRSTGSKIERAAPASAAAQSGRVFIARTCLNITPFFDEAELFPNGAHDDMVDAFSGAFNYFRKNISGKMPGSMRSGRTSYWHRFSNRVNTNFKT